MTSQGIMADPGARVGDSVVFTWNDTHMQIEGIIQHMPQGPGDSWIIYGKQGQIVHVQHFNCLRVLNRQAEDQSAEVPA